MRYKQNITVKRLFILITIIFSTLFAQAQKAKLVGKVTNAKNEALIGVSVSLKGDKNQATKTDIEGRFSFSIDINKEYTLSGSYVGYKENSISNIRIDNTNEDKKMILKEKANRYSYQGKIANFDFIKKVDKKLVNKRYGLSFADFKKKIVEN